MFFFFKCYERIQNKLSNKISSLDMVKIWFFLLLWNTAYRVLKKTTPILYIGKSQAMRACDACGVCVVSCLSVTQCMYRYILSYQWSRIYIKERDLTANLLSKALYKRTCVRVCVCVWRVSANKIKIYDYMFFIYVGCIYRLQFEMYLLCSFIERFEFICRTNNL